MTVTPVLMYHSIRNDPAAATRRLSVQSGAFVRQMARLRQLGFTTLTLAGWAGAVRDHRSLPERPIVLTFDDGYADFYHEALPILSRYGYTATVFVTTGWLDDAGKDAAGKSPDRMLTWRQVEEAAAAGIEIGGHSHSHPQLDQLPTAAVTRELRDSKSQLEDRLGQEVSSLAYPYGYSSKRVRTAAHELKYQQACVVGNTNARPDSDQFAVPRLTIRRSISPHVFEEIVRGENIGRIFVADRALTKAWAVARRTRFAVARIQGYE
jgi:peptidoglycan/xylan/chitin deacetylase (PgdA/CDA1 family)